MENTDSIFKIKISSFAVFFKLGIIGFLSILLLIPIEMIKSTISERQELNVQAKEEVGSKWANQQKITGPVLSIPVMFESDLDGKVTQETHHYHILPETLHIEGNIQPEMLKRGIYKSVVYRSDLKIRGEFVILDDFDKTNLKTIKSQEAFVTFGLSDLRGIEDEVYLKWNGQALAVNPGVSAKGLSTSGFSSHLNDFEFQKGARIPFEMNLKLKGSENLSFVPLGKSTTVSLRSAWTSPKFNGDFLPIEREVGNDGFLANWKVLELNRNYPQSWLGNSYLNNINTSHFGVDLLMPLDDYQKSMRSAKYAFMTIVLTFLVFFLVEILGKRNIHPFEYGMVGIGLSLFYILLVSISEHSTFNFAFGISAFSIIAMITLYSLSLFKAKRHTLILATILIGLFGFLFVTLQQEEYALLMGSVGLFIILAATMYFTRNVNWNNLKAPKPENGKPAFGASETQ
jgi:inner membrane protein